jgi:hypothetical protein
VVYAFFPETNQLELEDIGHLFDRGGITGGVWGSKGGRTVEHGGHVRDVGLGNGMQIDNAIYHQEKDRALRVA